MNLCPVLEGELGPSLGLGYILEGLDTHALPNRMTGPRVMDQGWMAERSEDSATTLNLNLERRGAGKNPQHVVTDKDGHGASNLLVVSLQKILIAECTCFRSSGR